MEMKLLCGLMAVGLLLPTASYGARITKAQKPKPRLRSIRGKKLGLRFTSKLAKVARLTSPVSALALIGNKKYGAGAGKLGLLDQKGKMVSSIKLPFKKVAGLAPFTKGACLVASEKTGSVYKVNLKTKKAAKIFALRDLKKGAVKGGNLITRGKVAGLAYDGRGNAFLATQAGYSSSIFKINVKSKKVVGHTFAPGPTPTALQYEKGKLFVVDQRSKLLRTFSPKLKRSSTAIKLPVDDARGLLIKGSAVEILSTKKKGIAKLTASPTAIAAPIKLITAIKPILVKIKFPILTIPRKFSVLITGDVAESGYNEFWNDTVWMYKMLRSAGYKKENIYVLYGNGADHISANPKYRHGSTVTDFPATTTWVNRVFNGLKNGDAANGIKKMNSKDSLFVWTFDHGAYKTNTSAYLCLMDAWMTSTHFANKLNAIKYRRRAIFMQQCYSGGFIPALQNSKTYISTACRSTEVAHRSDTENELYSGVWYCHGEYNYHLISAMNKRKPTGAVVNADTNGDGKVSACEAHIYMRNRESKPEHPQHSGTAIGSIFKIK